MAHLGRASPSRSPSRAVDDIEAVDYFAAHKSPSRSPSKSVSRASVPRAPPTPPQSSPWAGSPPAPATRSYCTESVPSKRSTSPSRSATEDLALSSLSVSSPSSRSNSGGRSASPQSASPRSPIVETRVSPHSSNDRMMSRNLPSVSMETAQGTRVMGQIGGIHTEMQELVKEIARLGAENEWLQSQLQETESSHSERLSRNQEEHQRCLNQMKQLERDLDDAVAQRDVAQQELQELEAQLEREMELTNQLRSQNSAIHDRMLHIASSPPPKPTAAPTRKTPMRNTPPVGSMRIPVVDGSGYPMSPRQMFGAPGSRKPKASR